MALMDNGTGLSAADVAAVTNGNNGFGFGGDGAWWIVILFLFAFMGGGSFGGYGGGVDATMQRGFDQSAVMNAISNLQTSMSNGFADAAVAQCNQTANMIQGFGSVNQQIANTGFAMQSQIAEGFRDVMENQNRNMQAIKDQLCQQEIDALKAQNENLRTQLNMQNLAASQANQTAQLIQDNNAQTAALINRIAPYPVPSYNVANPYANQGCGCGYNV